MSKIYNIRLTKSQLEVLAQATEILARLGIGQFRDALRHLPIARIDEQWHDDMDLIGCILRRYTINRIDGWTTSFAIESPEVREEARIAFDMSQACRYRLAWDKAIAEGIMREGDSLDYSDPEMVDYAKPLQTSREPLPEVKHAESV